jgi:hypothetical protein
MHREAIRMLPSNRLKLGGLLVRGYQLSKVTG